MDRGVPEAAVKQAVDVRLSLARYVVFYHPRPNFSRDMRLMLWRDCVERFHALKDVGLLVWRQNTGQAMLPGPKKKMMPVTFGAPGTADYVGILRPHGRWFGLEVKSNKRALSGAWKSNQSEQQVIFEAALTLAGGFYAVVREPSEVDAAVRRALEGATR